MGTSGGGLSAAQLPTETLFPGDTVEYFSMAFVAGDPRGHRVAKVLRVDRADEEFPIRVETQEMLPLTMMLKRKRDRLACDIPSSKAKWRKLRTFRLVDGEAEGETFAKRLHAGLKKAVDESFAAVRKQLAADNARSKSRQLMQSYFKPTGSKKKKKPLSSSISSDDGVEDGFKCSPSSESRSRSGKRHSTPLSARCSPLAFPNEVKAKTKRNQKHVHEKEDGGRPRHRMSSPSPATSRASKRDSGRSSKRRSLDFTIGQKNDRSFGETTTDDNDDNDDGDDGEEVEEGWLSSIRMLRSRTSDDWASPTSVQKDKKRLKIKVQKFMDHIEEKKKSAPLNEFLKLEGNRKKLSKIIDEEGLADSPRASSASRGTKTLELNNNAGVAHHRQESRKKLQDRDASGSEQIVPWLEKNKSATTKKFKHASPSSKKCRDQETIKGTPYSSQKRRRPMTALEAAHDEVFAREKHSKELTRVSTVKAKRSSDSLESSGSRKSSSERKRAKKVPTASCSSGSMDTWLERKKK